MFWRFDVLTSRFALADRVTRQPVLQQYEDFFLMGLTFVKDDVGKFEYLSSFIKPQSVSHRKPNMLYVIPSCLLT